MTSNQVSNNQVPKLALFKGNDGQNLFIRFFSVCASHCTIKSFSLTHQQDATTRFLI